MKPKFSMDRGGISKLRATWLGHACFLVEFPSGLRALFDPVFTDRCSPVSWLGPKRFTKMPCEIADIPIIDIVVISHNHYDHVGEILLAPWPRSSLACGLASELLKVVWYR